MVNLGIRTLAESVQLVCPRTEESILRLVTANGAGLDVGDAWPVRAEAEFFGVVPHIAEQAPCLADLHQHQFLVRTEPLQPEIRVWQPPQAAPRKHAPQTHQLLVGASFKDGLLRLLLGGLRLLQQVNKVLDSTRVSRLAGSPCAPAPRTLSAWGAQGTPRATTF